jgi:L-iditol 2-dehydrogenase
LVLGSGLSGMIHVQLARALGAGRVYAVDINDFRMNFAKRLGADGVIDARGDVASALKRMNYGSLADIVIVSTGAMPAIRQSFSCVDRGGTILFFAPSEPGMAVPMPFNEVWKDEITITTSYAGSPSDIKAAIGLIHDRKVSVSEMITHRLPLAETGLGFQLTAEAKDSLKVIIEPQK